jgi:hypothetical protein
VSYADERTRRKARRRALRLYAELTGFLIFCWAVVGVIGYGIYKAFT